jgi:hypothetical protein
MMRFIDTEQLAPGNPFNSLGEVMPAPLASLLRRFRSCTETPPALRVMQSR